MQNTITYNDILEDVDKLSLEEQESLIDVIQHRLIERRRDELAKEIQAVRQEYRDGKATVVSADELAREILS
ncbi:MAG: hypothetical protein EPO24_03760 [Bacteroidetes bacterium]|nr:MAG: hypothetical protein EPO24_03760 [Bacteroidota bacterium]